MKKTFMLLVISLVILIFNSSSAQAFSSVLGASIVPTQTISIEGNKVTSSDVPINIKSNKPSLFGYTTPNSKITLTFQSQIITREVLSDANGFWEYTLDVPLESGIHKIYMQVSDKNGNTSKNKLLAILKVSEANVKAVSVFLPILKKAKFNYLTISLGVLGSLAVLGILYAWIIKNSHNK